jgi:hypothetical protein
MRFGQGDRPGHHVRVTGMKAAGNIRRGDPPHHLGVITQVIAAETLTQVTIQVNS